ncbi:MAG: hypothetical protein KDA68_02540 [Planctomycetaceae bacterium]|nr:hypothetical protein [Planctomycetaceae bacterium]
MVLRNWLAGLNRRGAGDSRRSNDRKRRRHVIGNAAESLEIRTLLSAVGTPAPTPANLVGISAGAESEWYSSTEFTVSLQSADAPVSTLNIEPGAPSVVTSIEGLNYDENATNTGFYAIPPDPHGAVGPNHVVSVVNTSIEWHTKAGVQENSQRLGKNSSTIVGSFFEPLTPANKLFDPKVIYDQISERFIVVALERQDTARGDSVNTSRILVAVSDDSNPNGTWYYLAIDGKVNFSGTDTWADYPGLAIDEEAIYITNNQFTFGASNTSMGSRLWIINKSELYSNAASPTVNIYDPSTASGLSGQSFTIQPAHVFGSAPGSTGTFLVSTNWTSGSNELVSVVRVDNPLSSPTFSNQFVSAGDLQTNNVSFPDSPQPDTSIEINTNDSRALNAVWRNDNLYLVNTIYPNSGDNASEETTHWYKINTSNLASLTMADQGDIGGEDIAADTRTFFGSIAVDSNDNIAIGFSAAGPNLYAGAYYTIHRAGSTAGSTETPTELAAGLDYYVRTFTTGSTGRNRWGDYTATVVDPLDDSFWSFNEYALTRGTASGGEDGRWGTRWGKFTASLNNQPTLTASGLAFLDSISVNMPNASNSGTLISTLISRMSPGGITDPDSGDPQGIAINGASGTSTGIWEYSTDGGSSWASIGTVNNDTARLLASDSNTLLRYVPNAGFKGTAKISFVAWDQSTGSNGGTGVTKFRAGASPFSAAYDLASISVTNSAPVLDNSGAPTLDAITANIPSVNNPGTLIDTIISRMSPGGITDSDPGADQGIAINGLGGTSTGSWEYSTDNGSSWAAVGTTGNSDARLLAADGQTRIRYVPNVGFTGSAIFAFVAWDGTSGSNGSTTAVGTRGGTTAYSSVYEYASISITNSAPVLTVTGSAYLDSIPMNVPNVLNVGTLISDLLARSGGITDPDPGALQGIAINGLGGTTNGTWEYTIDGGTSWSTIGTTGNSNARLLASNANTRIRYIPNLGFSGTVNLAFVAWDQSSGVNGGITAVGTRGGSTAFSSLYDYATLSVS